MEVDLVFLDIDVIVINKIKFNSRRYKKETDREIILNSRSFAQLQQPKKLKKRTVHRIFNATRNWLAVNQVLNKTCSTKNQIQ